MTFVATAEALDDDMTRRIERHRADRPAWPTVEAPSFGAADVGDVDPSSLLILDCVTLLVSNLVLAERSVPDHIDALAEALAARPGPSLAISNEVGMGVHPETELGRIYRDELGWANRRLADAATDAFLVVAGRLLALDRAVPPVPGR